MWDQRVKNAIDSQLASKEWRQVESGGDVVVNVIGITRAEQNVHLSFSSWGGRVGPWGDGTAFGDAMGRMGPYAVGTLIVEIFDATSKNMVGWGLSSATLSSNSDQSTKKLDKDLEKMFKHFPPGSSGK
jgi:Domain of unknown function (DUF4136)